MLTDFLCRHEAIPSVILTPLAALTLPSLIVGGVDYQIDDFFNPSCC